MGGSEEVGELQRVEAIVCVVEPDDHRPLLAASEQETAEDNEALFASREGDERQVAGGGGVGLTLRHQLCRRAPLGGVRDALGDEQSFGACEELRPLETVAPIGVRHHPSEAVPRGSEAVVVGAQWRRQAELRGMLAEPLGESRFAYPCRTLKREDLHASASEEAL